QCNRQHNKETHDVAAEECIALHGKRGTRAEHKRDGRRTDADHRRIGQRFPHALAVARLYPPLKRETGGWEGERARGVEGVDHDQKQWGVEEYQNKRRPCPYRPPRSGREHHTFSSAPVESITRSPAHRCGASPTS